jgi:hypothetical protein
MGTDLFLAPTTLTGLLEQQRHRQALFNSGLVLACLPPSFLVVPAVKANNTTTNNNNTNNNTTNHATGCAIQIK